MANAHLTGLEDVYLLLINSVSVLLQEAVTLIFNLQGVT